MHALKRLVSIALGLGLLLSMAATSTAATSDNAVVEIEAISGAALSASITGVMFPAVSYSFSDTPTEGNFVITALDNRGTAAGWHIDISATPFRNGDESRSFGAGQLSLAAGTIAVNAGNLSIDGQTASPVSAFSGDGQEIWSADEGSGDGQYTLTAKGTLVVPGGTLVDTYSSIVTVAIDSGP